MRFLSHYFFLSLGFQTGNLSTFPAVLNIHSKWALTGVFITTSTTPRCCFREHSLIKIPPDFTLFNQSPQAIMKSCRWHVYFKYNLFQLGPILIKATQGEMGLPEPSWVCVFQTPHRWWITLGQVTELKEIKECHLSFSLSFNLFLPQRCWTGIVMCVFKKTWT